LYWSIGHNGSSTPDPDGHNKGKESERESYTDEHYYSLITTDTGDDDDDAEKKKSHHNPKPSVGRYDEISLSSARKRSQTNP
jgi:hypothetical protein